MLNSNNSTDQRPPPKRRNVPRYHSDHSSKSGGSFCLKCICCCLLFWFVLIILLAGAAYILYTKIEPEVPVYTVDHFDVNAFDVQHDFTLHTELVVTVKSDNPNNHIGFQYGTDSSVVVMYKNSILCEGKLPAFLQPHANATIIQIPLKGDSEFGTDLQEALVQNRNTGRIPLLVEVKAPISVVVLDFPMRQVTVLLNCSLVVDNLSPKKKARIISSKYNYAVEF